MFVMCGQSHFPSIVDQLNQHLTYQWIFSYLTPGGQAVQVWQQEINTFWKPVLWFSNGPFEKTGKWKGDVAKSPTNANEKESHDWGQSIGGMLDLMGRVVERGQTVFDPFCGAGATGVAALQMGYEFIGMDIDERQLLITSSRLN